MEKEIEKPSIWSRHAWLLLIVCSVFAASISRALWVEDTGGYYDCAVALAEGDVYPTDNNYFAYPLLIALSFLLFGKTLLAVQFAPFLCAVFAPLLMVKVALRAGFERRYAFLSGYLLLLFPFQLFHVNRPLTEGIFVCFFLLALGLFLRLKDHPRSWALFLPALSWLMLIRYDAVLFAGLAILAGIWIVIRARQFPWPWMGVGVLIAVLMQVPFAWLNGQRSEAIIQAAATKVDNAEHLETFHSALEERAATWEFEPSDEPIPLERARLQHLYDELVPEPRPPLAKVLTTYCRPVVEEQAVDIPASTSWLPTKKIKAWLYVGTHDPVGWMIRLGKIFIGTFPAWGIAAKLLAALLLGMGLQYGIRKTARTPNPLFVLLLIYFLLFNVLAITVIQGSVLRHLSRLAPVTILLIVYGMPRLVHLARHRFALITSLLVLSCVAVNAAHKLTRPDLVTQPMWEMMAANHPLTTHTDQLNRQHELEAFVVDRLKARVEAWNHSTDTFALIEDFTDIDSDLPNRHGRLGLSGSMAPRAWTKVLSVDRPVEYWDIETWAYMQYPKLTHGDALSFEVSTDGGQSAVEYPLPPIKQRLFQWRQRVPGEGRQELHLQVRFQNYGQCMAYINGQWFRVLSDTPGFYGTGRVHLHRYLLVTGRYE